MYAMLDSTSTWILSHFVTKLDGPELVFNFVVVCGLSKSLDTLGYCCVNKGLTFNYNSFAWDSACLSLSTTSPLSSWIASAIYAMIFRRK